MVQVKIEKLKHFWANNKQTVIVVVSALVLTAALLAVRAGAPFASFEAESANLSGNAVVKSDSAVSGGKYVEFSAGTSGGGGDANCRGISISPGENWQNKVNNNTNGTTFCIKAGIHKRQEVNVKPNNKFIGESGAVMDGENIAKMAFTGNSGDDNVVIKNLEIKNYNNDDKMATIHDGGDQARYWTLENLNIHSNRQIGVRVNFGWKLLNSKLHNNGRYAFNGSGPDILIEGNEVFNNPGKGGDAGAMKLVFTRNLIIRNNHFHDNVGNGIWVDINNVNTLYEGNRVVNNGRNGIFHEISCDAVIRNNYVEGNGYKNVVYEWALGGGIQVSNSPNVQVYGNTLVDNMNGISGINWNHPNLDAVKACEPKLKNFKVFDNNVTDPGDQATMAIDGNLDTGQLWSSYGIDFYRNTYDLSPSSVFRWKGDKTYSQWQNLGLQ